MNSSTGDSPQLTCFPVKDDIAHLGLDPGAEGEAIARVRQLLTDTYNHALTTIAPPVTDRHDNPVGTALEKPPLDDALPDTRRGALRKRIADLDGPDQLASAQENPVRSVLTSQHHTAEDSAVTDTTPNTLPTGTGTGTGTGGTLAAADADTDRNKSTDRTTDTTTTTDTAPTQAATAATPTDRETITSLSSTTPNEAWNTLAGGRAVQIPASGSSSHPQNLYVGMATVDDANVNGLRAMLAEQVAAVLAEVDREELAELTGDELEARTQALRSRVLKDRHVLMLEERLVGHFPVKDRPHGTDHVEVTRALDTWWAGTVDTPGGGPVSTEADDSVFMSDDEAPSDIYVSSEDEQTDGEDMFFNVRPPIPFGDEFEEPAMMVRPPTPVQEPGGDFWQDPDFHTPHEGVDNDLSGPKHRQNVGHPASSSVTPLPSSEISPKDPVDHGLDGAQPQSSQDVRAMFGIELEIPGVNVPFYARGVVLLRGSSWQLKTDMPARPPYDHSNLEFVLDPMVSMTDVESALQQIIALVERMRQRALTDPERTFRLADVADSGISLVHDTPVTAHDLRFEARLQTTHGISLPDLHSAVAHLLPKDQRMRILDVSSRINALFAERHGGRTLGPGALGLIHMTVMYLERARSAALAASTAQLSVKTAFRLMARSDFTSVHDRLLTDQERNDIDTLLLPPADGEMPDLMRVMGYEVGDRIFSFSYVVSDGTQHAGPGVADWLRSIVHGRGEGKYKKDLLSPPPGWPLHSGDLGIDRSMGPMGVDVVNQQVLFEVRGAPGRPLLIPLNGSAIPALAREYAGAMRYNPSLAVDSRVEDLPTSALQFSDDLGNYLKTLVRVERRLERLNANSLAGDPRLSWPGHMQGETDSKLSMVFPPEFEGARERLADLSDAWRRLGQAWLTGADVANVLHDHQRALAVFEQALWDGENNIHLGNLRQTPMDPTDQVFSDGDETGETSLESSDVEEDEEGDHERQERARLIRAIESDFGVRLDSDAGVEAVRQGSAAAPESVRNEIGPIRWPLSSLRQLNSALKHYAPIMGAERANSSRSSHEQEVRVVGNVNSAIRFKEKYLATGQYFKSSKLMNIYFLTHLKVNGVERTAVHELAHGLLDYALDDFKKEFWEGVESPWQMMRKQAATPEQDFQWSIASHLQGSSVFRRVVPRHASAIQELQDKWPDVVVRQPNESFMDASKRIVQQLSDELDWFAQVVGTWDNGRPRKAFSKERPPTAYGESKPDEDMADSAKGYFLENEKFRAIAPERGKFFDRLIDGWEKRKDANEEQPPTQSSTVEDLTQQFDTDDQTSPSVKAKYGFELEIPGATLHEPSRGTVLIAGTGWQLETDYNTDNTAANLEFVSSPAAGLHAVISAGEDIIGIMERMRTLALSRGSRQVSISEAAAGAIGNVTVVKDVVATVSDLQLGGRLQVTYGVGLPDIPRAIDDLLKAREASLIHQKSSDVERLHLERYAQPLSRDVRGFVELTVMYLQRAQAPAHFGGDVHSLFRMMMRSDFTSVYDKILGPDDRRRVEEIILPSVENDLPVMMEALAIEPEKLVFKIPYDGVVETSLPGPTVRDWLHSIVHGRADGPLRKDLLSPPPGIPLHSGDLNVDYGMGAMGVDEENRAILFEIRGAPYRPQLIPPNGRLLHALSREYEKAADYNNSLPSPRTITPPEIAALDRTAELFQSLLTTREAAAHAGRASTATRRRLLRTSFIQGAKNLTDSVGELPHSAPFDELRTALARATAHIDELHKSSDSLSDESDRSAWLSTLTERLDDLGQAVWSAGNRLESPLAPNASAIAPESHEQTGVLQESAAVPADVQAKVAAEGPARPEDGVGVSHGPELTEELQPRLHDARVRSSPHAVDAAMSADKPVVGPTVFAVNTDDPMLRGLELSLADARDRGASKDTVERLEGALASWPSVGPSAGRQRDRALGTHPEAVRKTGPTVDRKAPVGPASRAEGDEHGGTATERRNPRLTAGHVEDLESSPGSAAVPSVPTEDVAVVADRADGQVSETDAEVESTADADGSAGSIGEVSFAAEVRVVMGVEAALLGWNDTTARDLAKRAVLAAEQQAGPGDALFGIVVEGRAGVVEATVDGSRARVTMVGRRISGVRVEPAHGEPDTVTTTLTPQTDTGTDTAPATSTPPSPTPEHDTSTLTGNGDTDAVTDTDDSDSDSADDGGAKDRAKGVTDRVLEALRVWTGPLQDSLNQLENRLTQPRREGETPTSRLGSRSLVLVGSTPLWATVVSRKPIPDTHPDETGGRPVIVWKTTGMQDTEPPSDDTVTIRSLDLDQNSELIDPPPALVAHGEHATNFCSVNYGSTLSGRLLNPKPNPKKKGSR